MQVRYSYRDHVSDIAAPDGPNLSDIAAPGWRNRELAYVRVATDIEVKIASGELTPGTRLRAERELATHYGVAYGTVRAAMKMLRKKGLIITVHGRGTFVDDQAVTSPPDH